MYPDYDDFYQEPSEYDEKVEEFKESLRESVKQEWIDKMNKLEKENQELREVKSNWNELKRKSETEISTLKYECEKVKKNAEYNAREDRLKDLMKNFQQYYYRSATAYMYNHKCNKCGNDRKIHFKSPSGKDIEEKCSCAESIRIISPERYVIYEFSLRNGRSAMWLTESIDSNKNDCYYKNSEFFDEAKFIKDESQFINIKDEDDYRIFFSTKELCQKYCDWYNKNILKINVKSLISSEKLSNEEKRTPKKSKQS